MKDLIQRNYYKLHTGTNQNEGTDKIYLGYEASTTEIIFSKDKTTYFHVPFFTQTQKLIDSTLVGDGATPGPIPVMADRIQKKLGNYGDYGHWGTPSPDNAKDRMGTWLCSWLYSLTGEPPQWLDRYYYPGKITLDQALNGETTNISYEVHNPVYYDVPSDMYLEPGVWYQYFHMGENTAAEIVDSFAGDDKKHLRLDIEEWAETSRDKSIYQNVAYINNFKPEYSVDLKETGVKDRNVLNFNTTDYVDARVIYSSSYNLLDEFTINFWIQNNDWSNTLATQLVGNLNDGGFGVFYDNLKYYPYFVVPETYYGHIFYFNQNGDVFLDKSTLPVNPNDPLVTGISTPEYVALNSNKELIVLDSGILNSIYKTDHTGTVIATPKNLDGKAYIIQGTPKLLAVDKNNSCCVVTTLSTYYFDQDLTIQSVSAQPYITGERLAFNPVNGNLARYSCTDMKYDENGNRWYINYFKKLFYVTPNGNQTSLSAIDKCTNLAIDPENNVWVMHDINKISKISTSTKQLLGTIEVGTLHDTSMTEKNLSFIYTYDREKNTKTWYCVAYYNYDKTLYIITLDGIIKNSIDLTTKLNVSQTPPETQSKKLLSFKAQGDFTGYEYNRVFNKLLYNNNPQIQFKISTKKTLPGSPFSTQTLSVPVPYFANNTWHMITCRLKNKTMSLYIDTILRDQKTIPGNYNLNYFRKNDLYLGVPCGRFTNLNKELNTTSIIFNGYIDNIKIYDYAIPGEYLLMFIRERFLNKDLTWNIPTTTLQYIETIERFFKHKMPGSKSGFFKLKISGSKITDPNTRKIVEVMLKGAIEKLKPAYSELLSIDWMD